MDYKKNLPKYFKNLTTSMEGYNKYSVKMSVLYHLGYQL